MRFFLMSQGPFSPKIRFLGQKVTSVARRETDRKVKMALKSDFSKFRKTKKCVSSSCPKDHSVQKLGSQANRCVLQLGDLTDTKVKMVLNVPFFKISKIKKCVSFSCPKDPSVQKLGSQAKRCALQLGDRQTDRQTDRHESEYRGHPFRVSGFFKFSFNLSSRSGPIWGFDLLMPSRIFIL